MSDSQPNYKPTWVVNNNNNTEPGGAMETLGKDGVRNGSLILTQRKSFISND